MSASSLKSGFPSPGLAPKAPSEGKGKLRSHLRMNIFLKRHAV